MSGRPVEAGDRVFGVAGESLRPGGHVLGAGSPKYEVLRSDQKVSYLAHLGVQRVKLDGFMVTLVRSQPNVKMVSDTPEAS